MAVPEKQLSIRLDADDQRRLKRIQDHTGIRSYAEAIRYALRQVERDLPAKSARKTKRTSSTTTKGKGR